MRTKSTGKTVRTCCAPIWLGVLVLMSGCGPSLAVHKAIEKGQTDEALALIAAGKDITGVTLEGQTALQLAVHHGNANVAKALIEAGQDIEQPSRKGGFKPLYVASSRGHIAVARVLIEKGANVESTNAGGGSALLIAAQHGHDAVAELLVEHGADLNHQADNSMSPLAAAAREGHLSTVRLLLGKGADANVRETHGATPLLEAAIHRKIDVVELLVEKGADLQAADDAGFTPLMACARDGDLGCVKLLVDKGSDVEAQFREHSLSALHYAAFHDHTETVEYLISAGARLYAIEEGPGTYSTAVSSKLYGQYCEIGGRLDEAVTYYSRAGQYYEKAVDYFEDQATRTTKRVNDVEFGNLMRMLGAHMVAGMGAYGGGYGMASYRVYDTEHLEQLKKAHLDKAGQCRLFAEACRKLVDCYHEYSTPSEREDHARMLKDQLGLR